MKNKKNGNQHLTVSSGISVDFQDEESRGLGGGVYID